MGSNPQDTADLVTFTEEILNEKLRFFAQWALHALNTLSLDSNLLSMESGNKSCSAGLFCYLEVKNIFQISAYHLDYMIKLNIIKIC